MKHLLKIDINLQSQVPCVLVRGSLLLQQVRISHHVGTTFGMPARGAIQPLGRPNRSSNTKGLQTSPQNSRLAETTLFQLHR
jgi:hypothetical protein